jgi:hypothetical protein
MSINRIHVFVKEMPRPIQLCSLLYIASILGYNCAHAYSCSKQYLAKFRARRLTQQEEKLIKDEWDAVKYGATHKSLERLWNSIIWPISIAENIIPWIVLKLN